MSMDGLGVGGDRRTIALQVVRCRVDDFLPSPAKAMHGAVSSSITDTAPRITTMLTAPKAGRFGSRPYNVVANVMPRALRRLSKEKREKGP